MIAMMKEAKTHVQKTHTNTRNIHVVSVVIVIAVPQEIDEVFLLLTYISIDVFHCSIVAYGHVVADCNDLLKYTL